MRERAPTREAGDQQQIDAYLGYLRDSRQNFELERRERDARALNDESEGWTESAGRLTTEAADTRARGFTLRADELSAAAREADRRSVVLSSEADLVAANLVRPPRTEVEFDAWNRLNDDVGILAAGGVDTDDRSRVTEDDIPAPVEKSRRYDEQGGLRRPLAVHQKDLERAVPKDHRGRPLRNPDPREGQWFGLANDGGPRADATRGINCVDGVLSLFDTYVHGRPRVSAPRTFDSYAQGDPTRPLNPETGGLARMEATAQGSFVNLTPADPNPQRAVNQALTNLSRQLQSLEHGAFAFIITQSEGGDAHAWAAVNHGGSILFLDPQTGRLSEDTPLYTHTGHPNPSNVVAVSALLTNPNGEYSTIPAHLSPTPANLPDPMGSRAERMAKAEERRALKALPREDRRFLAREEARLKPMSNQIMAELNDVIAQLDRPRGSERISLQETKTRIKSRGSIARKLASSPTSKLPFEERVAALNDRIRFTIEVPQENYGASVAEILQSLRDRGFSIGLKDNYWGVGGRHYGLNVTVHLASGMPMEIQFPTPHSRNVGHDTHGNYEVVRQKRFQISERVEAFLGILEANKTGEMDSRIPGDIELTRPFIMKDKSFSGWIGKHQEEWDAYLELLHDRGETFDDVIRRHGLTRADVLGSE